MNLQNALLMPFTIVGSIFKPILKFVSFVFTWQSNPWKETLRILIRTILVLLTIGSFFFNQADDVMKRSGGYTHAAKTPAHGTMGDVIKHRNDK